MKKSKRVLNVFLVLCLLVTMLPVITMRTNAGSTFYWPLDTQHGISTGFYGYTDHNGVDMEAPQGTPVYANFSGNAIFYQVYTVINGVKTLTSFGNCVYITSDDGVYWAVYGHLNAFNGYSLQIPSSQTLKQSGNTGKIEIGSKHVNVGDLLGYVGTTGNSSGNHLHYGLKENGTFVNPANYLDSSRCANGGVVPPDPDPPVTDGPIVHMDYPSGSYGLDNNIEVKGWIASNEPVSYVLCDIDGYGQISLGMWDSPDEAAQYPQYQYFKRFNGVIEASKLTADQTYYYHVFTNLNSGAYLYNGSFSTNGSTPEPTTDWKIHLDTPTGTHTRYDHIELKGWLACNEKPAYIMAELVGKRQWVLNFWESSDPLEGYTYFMWFSTVIDVNLLESNQNYTILVWSSLGGPTSFTFSTNMQPEYYTLNYDANGGTNAPVSQSKKQLAPLQLTSTTPTRAGYTFKGWALTANASVADYQPGDEFTTDADTILYAVWEQGCDGSHSYGYRVSQSPTLVNTGVLVGSCEFCTAAVSVPLPILDDQSYTYTVQTVPGCESQGMGRYTWKVTQYGVYDFDVVLPAAGHSYQQTVIKPDCTTQGYTVHTCSVCGKSYQSDDTQPTGHSYTYQVTKAPTQTIQGTLTGSCNNCSASTQVVLPRLDTVSYTYTVTQEPTLTQTGIGCYTWNENAYGTFRFEVILEAEEEPDLDLPRITVESKTASRGQDVTLQVAIENNPGFSALQAAVRYDTQNLTLVSAENKIPSMIMTPGNSYVWDGTENYTDDGNILTLTFKINEEAPEGEYEIQLIFMSASNDAFEEVKMLGVSGTLNVIASVYGDANGDGKVTTVDLAMLRQYLSGMDPVTGESSLNIGTGADANGDGQISTVDLAMLRKYLAGMDPITGVSSVVLGPR